MKYQVSLTISILLVATTIQAQPRAFNYQQTKLLEVRRGAVVSAHPLASDAGLTMLRKGGNAIDAVIATQFALAVVYPGAGNLGGGGFFVARLKNGKNITIDYREKAPSRASRDMYLDSLGTPQPTLSQATRLASGVPGTVAGIFATHRYARLPIATLIEPAIELAEKGFSITGRFANDLNSHRETFVKNNKFPVAFVRDQPWKEGDTLKQPELAATLKRIRDLGEKGFYEGTTASLIVEEMKRGNGIISLQDLTEYKAATRTPMTFNYKGYQVLTMPLPSSGGVLLKQMLGMTGTRDLGSKGFLSPAAVQLMVEAERRAYADRAQYLGDPDFVKVNVDGLTSSRYLASRMSDFVAGSAGNSDKTKAGIPHESDETTHISVTDNLGNAVSVTTTLNDAYGNKVVVHGAGFIMNNEMDDFSIKEGFPNMYGALGSAANAIQAGKRMLSSMTPTILLRNGKPVIIVGSPGGTTIPTSVYQTVVDLVDFKLSPGDAVNKPKFHHQWLPDIVEIEKSFPRDAAKALEKMGYVLKQRSGIGRTELITINPVTKKITAVADTRGEDSAAGW